MYFVIYTRTDVDSNVERENGKKVYQCKFHTEKTCVVPEEAVGCKPRTNWGKTFK